MLKSGQFNFPFPVLFKLAIFHAGFYDFRIYHIEIAAVDVKMFLTI